MAARLRKLGYFFLFFLFFLICLLLIWVLDYKMYWGVRNLGYFFYFFLFFYSLLLLIIFLFFDFFLMFSYFSVFFSILFYLLIFVSIISIFCYFLLCFSIFLDFSIFFLIFPYFGFGCGGIPCSGVPNPHDWGWSMDSSEVLRSVSLFWMSSTDRNQSAIIRFWRQIRQFKFFRWGCLIHHIGKFPLGKDVGQGIPRSWVFIRGEVMM